jgi:hypothetical protein
MKAMEPVICTAQLAHATNLRSTPSGMIQPTSVRPAICQSCCQPHRYARLLRAQYGRHEREQMRDEANLREQPQCHSGGKRQECDIAPEQQPRARVRNRSSAGDRERAGRLAVGRQTHLLRSAGQELFGENPHHGCHD